MGIIVPERTVFQIEWTHVWLAAMTALYGGLVSYMRRVQSGHKHSVLSAFIHMTSSGFAGLICWLGCLQFDVPPPLTAICTGLAGHMGAEFIKIVEQRFADKLTESYPHVLHRAEDIGAKPSDGLNLGRRDQDVR